MKFLLALILLSSCTMTYEYKFGGEEEDKHEKHQNGAFNK